MLKRYSVLFDSSFRYQMDHTHGFGNCSGVLEALRFIYAIVAMFLHPEHRSDYRPSEVNSRRAQTAIQKYFSGCSEEHYHLKEMMDRATRVHFVLQMATDRYMRVTVHFFAKGEKQPIHVWSCAFDTRSGQTEFPFTLTPQ